MTPLTPSPTPQEICERLLGYIETGTHGASTDLQVLFRQSAATIAHLQASALKEERAHLKTIDERDEAQEAVSQAYYLVLGESPEWSNKFGYDAALDEIGGAVNSLKQMVAHLQARCDELDIRSTDEALKASASGTDLREAEARIAHLLRENEGMRAALNDPCPMHCDHFRRARLALTGGKATDNP
jgi:hypothetical protein